MEEFDRHIKSKIDSLNEVPGVEFDEERVWKKIKSNWSKGLFFGFSSIFILVSSMLFFLSKDESQRKIAEYNQVKESIPVDLIDSTIAQVTEGFSFENLNVEGADSIRDFKRKSSKEAKSVMNQSSPIHQAKKLVKKQSPSPPELVDIQVKEREKEISVSLGKESQTLRITHLKEVNNHLSLTYGIQFNRSLNQKFGTREGMLMPFEINQIQIPLGIRYNFSRRDRQFKPYLYTGFMNSFLLSSDSRAMDYNLKFESYLGIDYQIFSTEDGKKGYLRFQLPISNKNLINQGVYKPSLYDVLKH